MKLFAPYIMAVWLALALPAMAADQFVSVIEDLPLVTGLVENESAAVTFETANGRIAEAEARGAAAADAVATFYQNVLPQLGWTAVVSGLYQRAGERLRIDIESDGAGGVVVRYSVSPAPR